MVYWGRAQTIWPWAPSLSRSDNRKIIMACIKWAHRRWPNDAERQRPVLYRLHRSEGENPNDPSYGPWGDTIGAARMVEKFYPWPGYEFPESDEALAEKLSTNIDFACMVASGELLSCTKALGSVTYELRSIIRYKMGPGGRWNSKAAGIRKRHYGRIKATWNCIESGVRAGVTLFADCMKPGAS